MLNLTERQRQRLLSLVEAAEQSAGSERDQALWALVARSIDQQHTTTTADAAGNPDEACPCKVCKYYNSKDAWVLNPDTDDLECNDPECCI